MLLLDRHQMRSAFREVGLTQNEMARRLNVTQPDVARAERLLGKMMEEYVRAWTEKKHATETKVAA